MKILVVDDSKAMRLVHMRNLETLGETDVLEAGDGEQAVQVFQSNPDIGLVLLDWNMPRMNGLDALKNIRAANDTVGIVMITTESERGKVLSALQAGADNFIIKPYKEGDFQERIRELIE